MAEIKQSINTLQAVGTLGELNLHIVSKEKEINGKKIKGNSIEKIEFGKPSMTMEVNGNVIEINFLPTFEKAYNSKDNSIGDNRNYKSLETLMGYEKGTRLDCKGFFTKNEYANKNKNYEISSIVQILSFGASSDRAGEEDMCEGKMSGIIKAIRPEMKGEDETGRLIVEFYSFDKDGSCVPYDLIVGEELAEPFEDTYAKGDSCEFIIEVATVRHGSVTPKTVAFGRASKMTSGYTTTELQIVGGNPPYEEENEHYVDPMDFKRTLDEREVFLESLVAKAKENASGETKTAKSELPKKKLAANDCPF